MNSQKYIIIPYNCVRTIPFFSEICQHPAPVLDCQTIIGLPADGGAAIVVNSGNANAFTGREGVVATKAVTTAVADMLGL